MSATSKTIAVMLCAAASVAPAGRDGRSGAPAPAPPPDPNCPPGMENGFEKDFAVVWPSP